MAWDIAAGAAAGLVGQAANWLSQGANDRRQVRQQGKLNDVNAKTAKEMADYNAEKQMDLWNKTGYGAQKKQMMDAGINPALMYGGTASGGSTNAIAASTPGGGNAADAASTQMAGNKTAMDVAQLALMGAQKENIEADTANKQAGAGKATAETGAVGANIENTEANTKLTDYKADIAKIEAEVAGKTQKEAIATIVSNSEKAIQEQMAQVADTNVKQQTQDERVKQIKAESMGAILRNAATKTGIQLDQAKINEITQTLQQKWEQLKIGREGLQVARDNMEELTEAMLWGAGIQAGGNVVKGVMDIATKGGTTLIETDRIDAQGRTSSSRTTTGRIR